jgi:acyl carrier protein
MPNNPPLTEQICNLFTDYLYVQVPSNDVDLIDAGLLDSLSLVDLLVRLEKEFGINVVMDQLDLDDFRTVDRIGDYVGRMIAAKDVNESSSNEEQMESK